MIRTVTFNPAIDYIVEVQTFKIGEVNRVTQERIVPGGKGINVSIVLQNLGISNKALGFVAGFTGMEITRLLEEKGIQSDFVVLEEGHSRINMKLNSQEETEINAVGPYIPNSALEQLHKKIDELQAGDFLVLAGSIQNTLSSNTYGQIMRDFRHKNIQVIVDGTKDLLMNALEYRPFLIKPNHHELGELFDSVIETQEQAIIHGKKLQEKGARNVLVSMADKGAIFIAEDGSIMKHRGIKGIVKNSVGAGDSMIAGFIAGYIKNQSLKEAFKMSIATATASAFSDTLATKAEVEYILKQL